MRTENGLAVLGMTGVNSGALRYGLTQIPQNLLLGAAVKEFREVSHG